MLQLIALFAGALVSAYVSYAAFTGPVTALYDIGIFVLPPDGTNEIRAQYGGFYAAVTLALTASLAGYLPRRFGLGLLLVTIGGILAGRLASLAIDGFHVWGQYSGDIKAFYIVDAALTALTIAALLVEYGTEKKD